WPKLSSLSRLCGDADAVRVARGSEAAIDEIGEFCERHGIDAHFRKAGWLWTATSAAQLGAWDGVVALCERLGVGTFRRLPSKEIARRPGWAFDPAGGGERS